MPLSTNTAQQLLEDIEDLNIEDLRIEAERTLSDARDAVIRARTAYDRILNPLGKVIRAYRRDN
jgi:hypothetical protein